MDKDTWSRSMVAALGLDTVGASFTGVITRRSCHPSTSVFTLVPS